MTLVHRDPSVVGAPSVTSNISVCELTIFKLFFLTDHRRQQWTICYWIFENLNFHVVEGGRHCGTVLLKIVHTFRTCLDRGPNTHSFVNHKTWCRLDVNTLKCCGGCSARLLKIWNSLFEKQRNPWRTFTWAFNRKSMQIRVMAVHTDTHGQEEQWIKLTVIRPY